MQTDDVTGIAAERIVARCARCEMASPQALGHLCKHSDCEYHTSTDGSRSGGQPVGGGLVERLRKMHDRDGYPDRLVNPDGPEAADTITTLRAEVEALRGALEQAVIFIEQNYNPLAMLPYNLGPARAAMSKEQEHGQH